MTNPTLDALELELRQLPGVVGVGMVPRDDLLDISLLISGPGSDELRRAATEVARGHVAGTTAIHIRRAEAREKGGGRPERVQLVGVRMPMDEDQVEVHLSHRGTSTVGRGPAGELAGAVGATFQALEQLGVALPFRLDAATAVLVGVERGVLVVLRDDDSTRQRLGVALATTAEESASRATLHALNRYLAVPSVLGPGADTPVGVAS